MTFKLAIFDMDGTVFESYLNWEEIKQKLNLTNKNILKEIYKNTPPDFQKIRVLEKYEEENTKKTKPFPGINEFFSYLNSQNIKTALTTNNNKKNTLFLLDKYKIKFDSVITREMKLWKPDPDPFVYLMNLYRCNPSETFTIGDSHYDIFASEKSYITNIFIKRSKKIMPYIKKNMVLFDDFFELRTLIKQRMQTFDLK